MRPAQRREPKLLLAVGLLLFALSGYAPHDRLTWWLEVVPILIGIPVLVFTARAFPMTSLSYRLIALHAVVLMVGGHYTYAEVPLGFWVQDAFDLSRNHYDRLGHVMQGAVPAILAREILLRRTPLRPGKMLFFLAVCICMAISAWYELLEWGSAIWLGQGADAFLGTQGDPWDTQKDMFCAFLGATFSLIILGRLHDRELRRPEGKVIPP